MGLLISKIREEYPDRIMCTFSVCPSPSSSRTTPPSPCTSSSRTPTSACALTTRPCTTSASAPSSSPPRVCRRLRRHLLHPLPGPAQRRPPQARREPDPVPASSLLHDRLRPAHLPRLPAVPRPHGTGAHPAAVRCQEHDERRRPPPRPLPHRRLH